MNELNELSLLREKLNGTNSVNDKVKILINEQISDNIKSILAFIHDPDVVFGIKSKTFLSKKDKIKETTTYTPATLMNLMIALSNKEFTGHTAIKVVDNYIKANKEHEELILMALDKNLKCRIDAKLLNKAFPDLISLYQVALAEALEDIPESKRPNFTKELWYASRKMNGLRCLIEVRGDDVQVKSRKGKDYPVFIRLAEAVKRDLAPHIAMKNYVLDGEVCLIDENGNEDFKGVLSMARRIDYICENPRFKAFDLLTMEEFEAGMGSRNFGERFSTLLEAFIGVNSSFLDTLEQVHVLSQSHLETLNNFAISQKWEGLMLRKHVPYEAKRTHNLVKVKVFKTAEFVVEDIERSTNSIIVNGVNQDVTLVTKLVIRYKGFPLKVGSGLTHEEGLAFHNNPSLIVGKTISVRYFEETSNKKGELSIQFPTYQGIYGEKREI